VTTPAHPPRRGALAEFGRFLEIQNLALNLPFALAFLLVAAHGTPSLRTTVLVVVAFVAARNAGHSFNRWADRRSDAANPRTRDRALVTGRYSPGFALAVAFVSAGITAVAAFLLNPVTFALAPVALAIVFGYSLTKRISWLTTVFLGLVESLTPAAVFLAVQGRLPIASGLAVGALLAWGTAFETVHSLGDLDIDRALGLPSLPVRFGEASSVRIVLALQAAALGLLALFGLTFGLDSFYYAGLATIGALLLVADHGLVRRPRAARTHFRRYFVVSSLFLLAVAAAEWLRPILP
jgi:4-hydroxybenzoate polyprenyltransferase